MVLVVLSLLLSSFLAAVTQQNRLAKRAELEKRLNAIEWAIHSHAKNASNYALPCPADPTLALTNASFGTAVASGCASIPAAYRNSNFAVGTVPVRTIGLPDEYAFDPWGNKFSYAVTLLGATTNSLITYPVSSNTSAVIRVDNAAGSTMTSNAMMVLVSHGPNGFGAFNRQGGRNIATTSNAAEQLNCGCTASGGDFIYAYFVRDVESSSASDVLNSFDDTVRYYERGYFLLNNDYLAP